MSQQHQRASIASAVAQGQKGVVMVPIIVINSQDSEAMDSALPRTEVALAGVTVSSHQDSEPSVINLALKSVLSNDRMDRCHLSDDVKYFTAGLKTTG